jgi:hypothetical protein
LIAPDPPDALPRAELVPSTDDVAGWNSWPHAADGASATRIGRQHLSMPRNSGNTALS